MTSDDATRMTEKQRRVLDAALEVFAERGYAATTTSEIAKRAGVAEGTIFKQYKTKKELLIGVVAPLVARFLAPSLIEEVRNIVRQPDIRLEEFLRALYENRVAFVEQHERLLRVLMQEVPFHAEVRELALRRLTELILPDLLGLITRYQHSGEVRAGDPTSILRLIVGTMATYVVTKTILLPNARWDDAAEIDLMVAVLAQGLRPPAPR